MNNRKLWSSLLLAALVLTACGGGAEKTAAMYLRDVEGEVWVSDEQRKDVPLEEDLPLYSGWRVDTWEEGGAWIDLDEAKEIRLDAGSQLELSKTDGDLEVFVKTGGVFFRVTEPLGEDESLLFRTPELTAEVRGTCGWIGGGTLCLLEGKVRCETENGEKASVSAGEKAVLAEDGSLAVTPLSSQDIPAYVREEIEEDEDLLRQIAEDTGNDPLAPSPVVVRMGQATTIADNDSAQAVVKADGTLWMRGWGVWGNNTQVFREAHGTGDTDNFTQVMENVSAVCLNGERGGGSDVPNSTVAVIDRDGVLWMWGDGALGDGVWSWDRSSGDPVRALEDVQAVSMGHDFTMALKKDGTLWAWGVGIMGDGTEYEGWMGDDNRMPVKVMDGVSAVSTCGSTTAVIKNDGSLWMWGYNDYGQLGTGTTGGDSATSWNWSYQRTPVKVMDGVAAVSVSLYHTAAVKTDGSLWTWGLNDCGQLGNGGKGNGTVTEEYVDDYEDYEHPKTVIQPIQTQPVKVMDGAASVFASIGNTYVVGEDGSLWHCGVDENGTETGFQVYSVDMTYGREVSISSTPVLVRENTAAVSGVLVLDAGGTVWTGAEQAMDGAAVPAA